MNELDKKNFTVYPKCHSLGKRWFISYYQYDPGFDAYKIKKLHGNINSFNTVNERLLAAEKLINEIKNPSPKTEQKKSLLEQALEIKKPLLKKRGYDTLASKVKLFKNYWKHSELKFNQQEAQLYVNYLIQQGYKPKTINTYIENLRTLFTEIVNLKLIKENPFQNIKYLKAISESKMYFSVKQQKHLKANIENANPQLWTACQMLFYCFIRPAEMRFLKVKDVNLEENKIIVRGSVSKNGKTQTVAIPKPFVKHLQYLNNYSDNLYVFGKKGEPNENPTAANWISKEFTKKLKQLNYDTKEYSLYSWKHTGAVMCIKAGIHIKELQMQLRHHSLDMVNEYLKDLGVMDCENIKNNFPEL